MIVAAFFTACDPPQLDPDDNNNGNANNNGNGNGNGNNTEQPTVKKPSQELQQADQFAIDLFSTYYLWTKEVKKDLPRLNPDTCKTPIAVVKKIRYHNSGKEVDHWTSLTNNLDMTSSVQGLGLSYGYGLQAYWADNTYSSLVLVVQYASKGKPAAEAGLKRGDVIWTINGKTITLDNYYDAYDSESITIGVGPKRSEVKSVSMTANKDWEDPIILSKTFDINGKKVGYLVYNSFDLKTSETLPGVFAQFKADGINELIIDLRYNGGGYTSTECVLASLIAPPATVEARDIFQTEVVNELLAEAWKDDDLNTYFVKEYKGESDVNYDIVGSNPGVSKLYAIVTQGTASASEGLLIGLAPFMNVVLVGDGHTYGKYCAGYMMSPENLYGSPSRTDYSKITKWGMYVMFSMFADKNKENAAQPDGIPVNINVKDDLLDGYQLGDEEETMLKAALKAAGKVYTKSRAEAVAGSDLIPVPDMLVMPARPWGLSIKTDVPPFTFEELSSK